jgi:predicted alpha/beta-fold hydrolase
MTVGLESHAPDRLQCGGGRDLLEAPPWWLAGGHVQTLWSALRARPCAGAPPRLRRERWSTPDGDFIDVDWLGAGDALPPAAPLLVLFHGLEGSSASHYAQAFAAVAQQRGWRLALPHFRGCSGEINRAPRAYHSGDFAEIDWVLHRLQQSHPAARLLAVGVSLGGNALMRWAVEAGTQAASVLGAAAAVCSPLDLAAAGRHLDQGWNRLLYVRMFLRTMRLKAEAKWRQYPGLFDLEAVRRARTLHEFDDAFTAPLHGFRDVDDYWQRAAARPGLGAIRLPALLLNARNDPFVPAASLPRASEVGSVIELWQPDEGGHVGFPAAGMGWAGHVQSMPWAVTQWLQQAAGV